MKIEKEHQKYPFILKQSYGGKGVNSQFSNNNYIKPIVNRFDEILSSNFLSTPSPRVTRFPLAR